MSILSDPFPVAKEEVQSEVNSLRAQYERWREIVENEGDQEELEWIRGELTTGIQNIEWDLEDMTKAIEAVEKDSNYHIDNTEIASRRKFVNDTRSTVLKYKNEVSETARSRGKKHQKNREDLLTANQGHNDNYSRLKHEQKNQEFIDDQLQQREQLIKEQDVDLEGLSGTVVRLGELGNVIHDEIEKSGLMIDELNEEMDRTEGRMSAVMSKVKTMLEKSDNGKMCTIFVLTIVFILLLVGVIYT